MINLSHLPTQAQIQSSIERDGYFIGTSVINPDDILKIKNFWIKFFRNKGNSYVVRGNLVLGEKNFTGFENTDYYGCLHRHFDFLWNYPTHSLTRDLAVELHKYKNLVLGKPSDEGLIYNSANFGVYISTSYYPPEIGRLNIHRDACPPGESIIHFMIPITFKGIDYQEGGLVCIRDDGQEIDLDSQMKPGSILFFNARLRHAVRKLKSKDNIGRLATFAIPVHFVKSDSLMTSFTNNLSRYIRGNPLAQNLYRSIKPSSSI
ncbi:MAG: hypothetical protein AB8G05_12965 [Oligoflexales bacterium]